MQMAAVPCGHLYFSSFTRWMPRPRLQVGWSGGWPNPCGFVLCKGGAGSRWPLTSFESRQVDTYAIMGLYLSSA